MPRRQPLIPHVIDRLKFLRYRMFGRGPTKEEWEQRLQRIVAPTVVESLRWIPRQGGSFIDIGANIGLYSQNVLRERPDARAWLFEPVREHYESCLARLRPFPGVVVENLALGPTGGPSTIWKSKHNPGGNVIDEKIVTQRKSFMHFRPEKIRMAVFDEYAKAHGISNVDFIKTDTDGYDARALQGMLGFLEGCNPRPVILAELMNEGMHPDYAGQVEVLEALYGLGYGRIDLSGMADVQDFVFVPEGRAPVA
jgi:FkbM family methyltransferase